MKRIIRWEKIMDDFTPGPIETISNAFTSTSLSDV